LEIIDQLFHGPDLHERTLQYLVWRQLTPSARQLCCGRAAIIRHDDHLHQSVDFQLRIALGSRHFPHQSHPLVDARRLPAAKIGRFRSAPKSYP
jgi:hypothetical protein